MTTGVPTAKRPFFHPSDAGLPVIALLEYARIAAGAAGEHPPDGKTLAGL